MKRYTTKEIEYIKLNYRTKRKKEIGHHLNRAIESIRKQGQKLGVNNKRIAIKKSLHRLEVITSIGELNLF